jgi:methionyl aminopeptidase
LTCAKLITQGVVALRPCRESVGARPGAAVASRSMAIERYTHGEQLRLRRACKAAAATLTHVSEAIQPGITKLDIDALVRVHTHGQGGRPSQLGYRGFPAAVCTSVNDVVCHGIPTARVRLRAGDIVNVDITTELDGFHGDTSATFFVGQIGPAARALVGAAEAAMWQGIKRVRPGARLGDVGAAIAAYAGAHGYSVVGDYGGHGIGRAMHMPPHVSHVAARGTGPRLHPGMAFTIEPMLNAGLSAVRTLADGWTVVTADGRLSAQFEHTVLVTESGVDVLTVR